MDVFTSEVTMNRKWNVKNPNQGSYKKVLCVCSAELLRSPTAAIVLSRKPFDFNTRSCGMVPDYAVIVLDGILMEWADEIVCMDATQQREITKRTSKPVINLNVPDVYEYRHPDLMRLIARRYKQFSLALTGERNGKTKVRKEDGGTPAGNTGSPTEGAKQGSADGLAMANGHAV